ncbi:uncharacterized protein IWZ02DRAFT_376960 [Phyllosticta citriasiana]|uniref:Letm1 RBD domain-containing protein n=1 Tax=Phyllosticta citriasiana TaxID=595635 RepID=A0ABR1KSV8_9PEZI
MSTLLRIGRPARVHGISPCLQSTRRLSARVKRVDRVNPPISTLPAPVNLPAKDAHDSKMKYWFETGKAYLSFFKTGVRNVWANSKAARELRKSKGNELTRAEFQLIVRSRHDVNRLPIFAIVLLVFGEFTPLVAPFLVGVMPKTCRPPQTEEGLARRAEIQRQTAEQRWKEVVDSVPRNLKPLIQKDPYQLLGKLRTIAGPDEEGALREKSTHWGPLSQAIATRIFLKREHRRHSQYYTYLIRDSELLLRDGEIHQLSTRELRIACMERGINVLDRSDAEARNDLMKWLLADRRKREQTLREDMPEMKKQSDQWMEAQKIRR